LEPAALLAALQDLRRYVEGESREIFAGWCPWIRRHEFLASGLNLAQYLALRHRDLRPLQEALVPWGLSSLGRSEGHVMASLDAVVAVLGALVTRDFSLADARPPARAFTRGARLLRRHTDAVLGASPAHRPVRILVTLPDEAATDYGWMRDLVARGMDCIRINCAHGTPDEWERMIRHLRGAEAELGRSCRVLMDLAGPKARTGWVVAPERRKLTLGERLLLTREEPPAEHPVEFRASCTLPEVLDQLAVGASVWIDDGAAGAVVEEITPAGAVLRVAHSRPGGLRLKPEKGLNFPDTDLSLSPLTPKDREDLDFVARHADVIGYSFVQERADVELLQEELAARLPDPYRKGIVAKIETRKAVRNLPELIVSAAGRQPFAVMIARGDLAVEIGYERLAEIQEEILWLCEAAHVPVIWATQVLERLVKKGTPTRAEITDAAMGERAECVMLNKGPFLAEAVSVLDSVLTRMAAHQSKKTAQLRALRSW
jgi:pyruvate kinase